MNLKKTLYRNLRKYGFLPKLEVKLNKQHRNINHKNLTYNINSEPGRTYEVSGAIYSPALKKTSPKAALISLIFFDKNGTALSIEDAQGFSKSKKIGYYKYLPVSSVKNKFNIFFTAPTHCVKIKLVIMKWEEKKSDIYLQPNTTLRIISSSFDNDKIAISNHFS